MVKKKRLINWQKVQSIEDLEIGRKYMFRPEYVPILYSYLGIKPGIIAADIGCGTGYFSRLMARGLGGKGGVVGVDLDKRLLKIAKEKAKEEGLSNVLEFICGDAYNLPFQDNSFDVITSHTLLAALQDLMKCILEKKRVAKVGGYVSTVEAIPRLEGYLGYYPDFPHLQRLNELYVKKHKIWGERIYPKLGIGSDVSPFEYPRLFLEAGLRDIIIDGFLCVFSISDARYSLEEMKEYLRRNYENDVRKILEIDQDEREEYRKGGMTNNDFEELLFLLRKEYEYLIQKPERIRQVMKTIIRPRIIVRGTKQNRKEEQIGGVE